MAGIDKTYINGNEYPLYRKWWINNYDKMVKELGRPIYLLPFAVFDNEPEIMNPKFLLNNKQDLTEFIPKNDFAIWNTSEKIDKWLIKNCNIESFRDRMLKVYSHDWDGFKGCKWIPKPKIKQKCNK